MVFLYFKGHCLFRFAKLIFGKKGNSATTFIRNNTADNTVFKY
jgi:hypothetical protein